jgi:hypothetical protein
MTGYLDGLDCSGKSAMLSCRAPFHLYIIWSMLPAAVDVFFHYLHNDPSREVAPPMQSMGVLN